VSTIVIYHGNCIDGYTAAWAAWRKFGMTAAYVPAHYGSEPPDVGGHDVLVVDFSYRRATLEAMKASAKSLRVLDHHKTAKEDLEGLEYDTFDMDRSGAGITWDELHGSPRPWLVDYVEDRDLWRFKMWESKSVNAFVGAHKRTSFAEWQDLSLRPIAECARMGSAVEMFTDRYVEEMCAQAAIFEIDGMEIPVVNAPYINTSELVGALSKDHPFAIGWFQNKDGRCLYSLRSRGDFDVSAFAKRFGGGGHKNAAGFNGPNPPDGMWTRLVTQ
jgi:oligoribonuclease NrnB/cAMP/cGMP phosphodiesterase (DHH superfamily)